MGAIIYITNDGLRAISDWASGEDLPDSLDYDGYVAETERRKSKLFSFGMSTDSYGRMSFPDGPVYPILTRLLESNIIPELSEYVDIDIREFPPASPGEMYQVDGVAKPFGSVTLSERVAALGCRHCRNSGLMGDADYEVVDDNGNISMCRGCHEAYFGDGNRGFLPDDFQRVTSWNEQGNPKGVVSCPGFDYD